MKTRTALAYVLVLLLAPLLVWLAAPAQALGATAPPGSPGTPAPGSPDPGTQQPTAAEQAPGVDAYGAPAELGRALSANEQTILGPGHWHRQGAQRTWYGSYRSLANRNAYCIDAGMLTPYPKYFAGVKPSTVRTARTAWALAAHSDSGKADVQAALSAIVKLDAKIPHRHRMKVHAPSALGANFAGAAKQYAAITRDAKRLAGPYRLRVALAPVPRLSPGPAVPLAAAAGGEQTQAGAAGTQLTATISLTAASGAPLPGRRVELSTTGAQGPAAITTAAKPVTVMLTAPDTGTKAATVALSARAKDLPGDAVRLYRAHGRGSTTVQNIVTAGPPVAVSARAEHRLPATSQPRVTTRISTAEPAPGARLHDAFTVSGLAKGQRVTVEHTLWASPAKPQRTQQPAKGTAKIGTVTSKGVGNGTQDSPSLALDRGYRGWVYWTERIAPAPGIRAWQSDHGIAEETGLVPWTPQATTTAALDNTANTSTDAIAVRGARPGSRLRVTATPYRTDTAPVQSASASGTPGEPQAFDVTVGTDGTARATTRPVPVDIGWTTWVVRIDGGEGWKAWQSEWGIPAETVHRAPTPSTTAPTKAPATTAPATTAPPTTVPPVTPSPSAPATTTAPAPETTAPVRPQAPGPQPPVSEAPAPQPGSPEAPSRLPRTGTQAQLITGGALILIGGGAVLLLATARRRRD
ncbi:hypothetical protein BRM1_07995 [Brevibacterium sp. BRM-1]|uniref:hypothetical protein n=1 Tax=Brevibacterium sp. BRM-1 TaxID=2999062 RepID=UPI002280E090|nr:hypothetical protein [Brevibacterium sp. BRM-1]WAL39232.1 hypothetical protein BRM1_07995 [Brevibacterium sp. BRM-1]